MKSKAFFIGCVRVLWGRGKGDPPTLLSTRGRKTVANTDWCPSAGVWRCVKKSNEVDGQNISYPINGLMSCDYNAQLLAQGGDTFWRDMLVTILLHFCVLLGINQRWSIYEITRRSCRNALEWFDVIGCEMNMERWDADCSLGLVYFLFLTHTYGEKTLLRIVSPGVGGWRWYRWRCFRATSFEDITGSTSIASNNIIKGAEREYRDT